MPTGAAVQAFGTAHHRRKESERQAKIFRRVRHPAQARLRIGIVTRAVDIQDRLCPPARPPASVTAAGVVAITGSILSIFGLLLAILGVLLVPTPENTQVHGAIH